MFEGSLSNCKYKNKEINDLRDNLKPKIDKIPLIEDKE